GDLREVGRLALLALPVPLRLLLEEAPPVAVRLRYEPVLAEIGRDVALPREEGALDHEEPLCAEREAQHEQEAGEGGDGGHGQRQARARGFSTRDAEDNHAPKVAKGSPRRGRRPMRGV